MKSWRTTTFGIICWLICGWLLWQGNDANQFNIHRISDSLHYLVLPFLAFAVGWGFWHARDHKSQ